MRLLQADTLQLVEFTPDSIPPYAILSHTWGTDEVLFVHMINDTAKIKQSYDKVRFSCTQTLEDGLKYVWIDTCCIDKRSSAELSEAINSMFAWYQKAEVCYAYLSDVPASVNVSQPGSLFASSRWFTRGWTLQELLAPSDIVFYSDDWTKLGEKRSMSKPLAEITGIDENILLGAKPLESASVAKRMSWAANRKTTRPEDIAYCLMGVFKVNMPMLYGEGDRAFLRLQEEIMKLSDDQSLFAWLDLNATPESCHGLLAKSPSQFAHSNTIFPYQDWEPRKPYSMTNRGLSINLYLTRREKNIYVAAIDCPAPPNYEESSFLAIYLRRLTEGDLQFMRVRVGQFAKVHDRGNIETLYVKQSNTAPEIDGVFPRHILQLRKGPNPAEYRVVDVKPSYYKARPSMAIISSRATTRLWLDAGDKFASAFRLFREENRVAAAVIFERDDGERLLILLGSAAGFEIGFSAIELVPNQDLESEILEFFQIMYVALAPGTFVDVGTHRVCVNAEPQIHNASKYYMIDIEVEALEKVLRPIDLVKDVISGDIDNRVTLSRLVPKSEGKKSVLMPWKRKKNKMLLDE